MTITETIGQVTNNSLSSIYTKEDVIRLLENIKQEENKVDIEKLFEELKNKIERTVQSLDSSDVCDFDSVELSMHGREVEVDGIDVNHDTIWDNIERCIDNFSDNYADLWK